MANLHTHRILASIVFTAALVGSISLAQAGNGTWINPADGSWTNSANWSAGAMADGSGYTADFSTLNLTTDTTVTLDGNRTIANLLFGDTTPSNNWFLNTGTGSTLTLDSTGTPTLAVSNQTATISVPLAGTKGLVKTGTGKLVLTGSNIYTGTTTISAGTLQAKTPGSLPGYATSGKLLLSSGATVVVNVGGAGEWNAASLAGLIANSAAYTATSYVGIDTTNASGGAFTYATAISGANIGIKKLGSGTLTLNVANSHSGGTRVEGGMLKMGVANCLGALYGQVTITNGATLDVAGVAGGSICEVVLEGNGVNGTGALINTGGNANLGAYQVPTNLRLTGNAAIGGTGNTAQIQAGYGTTTVNLAGFTLTKLGTNTHFFANTTVTAGTLRIAGGVISQYGYGTNGSAATFLLDNTTGVGLDLANLALSAGTLAGGGTTGGNVILGYGLLTVGGLNQNATYGGVISGTGGVTKVGTGTQTFSGTNTYTGATTVSAGALLVTGSLANSAVAVATGGTFGGTGTVNGAVTMNGTLAPGVGDIGTLTVNNTLVLASTSTAAMQIRKTGTVATSDTIQGLTGITYGGTLAVTASGDALAVGDSFILFTKSSGSYTGSFATIQLPTLTGGMTWDTSKLATEGRIFITKLPQAITFAALTAKTYGNAPFALTATASSSLTVTYTSSNPAVATVSGSTVTIVGGGTTTITASQAGDANYSAATPVAQMLTVNKAAQTITFAALPAKTYGIADFAPSATTSSGLAVTYVSSNTAVATIVSSQIHIVGVGTSTITASQAGNANYNAATNVSQTLTVNKASQTISVGALSTVKFGDAPFALTATASSGLLITYTSSDTGVATVSNNLLTIVTGGTVTITAAQAGNANYNAATNVIQTLNTCNATSTADVVTQATTWLLAQQEVDGSWGNDRVDTNGNLLQVDTLRFLKTCQALRALMVVGETDFDLYWGSAWLLGQNADNNRLVGERILLLEKYFSIPPTANELTEYMGKAYMDTTQGATLRGWGHRPNFAPDAVNTAIGGLALAGRETTFTWQTSTGTSAVVSGWKTYLQNTLQIQPTTSGKYCWAPGGSESVFVSAMVHAALGSTADKWTWILTAQVTSGSDTGRLGADEADTAAVLAWLTITDSAKKGAAAAYLKNRLHKGGFWGNGDIYLTAYCLEGLRKSMPSPTITVLGANPVTVARNSSYLDAGATAVDPLGHPVNVMASGSINTTVAGSYTVTYTAKDTAGNLSTATRTVTVSP